MHKEAEREGLVFLVSLKSEYKKTQILEGKQMIDRYTSPEMGRIWTELFKKRLWLKVELAGLWAKEKLGMVPAGTYESAKRVRVTEKTLIRANELERINDHDLIAFVLAITEKLVENARMHFHAGFTSYDIEDTALALQLVQSLKLIMTKLRKLRAVIRKRASEHRYTIQIGRTHYIHAEPITFGVKLLGWLDIVERHLKRLSDLLREIAVGKMSGAVGVYVLDPKVEKLGCSFLGLRPAKISTQILSRDILVRYTSTLVAIVNSIDRFATEIRHLAGTDTCEVSEHKKPGAKGSSAMPGKSKLRNPIKSENVCGLARVVRGFLIPAFECEVVWCERSLENSSAERIYLPDLTILTDFVLKRFAQTLEKLEVYPEQMMRNLWKTGGIVFAQRVMLKLIEKGMPRHEAYALLEELALKVEHGTFETKDERAFTSLVYSNMKIFELLSREELDKCFDPMESLKYIDKIFTRFGIKKKK